MSFPSDLPDNIDALKAMLVAAEAQISTQDQALADRDAVIERKEDRIIRLVPKHRGQNPFWANWKHATQRFYPRKYQ